MANDRQEKINLIFKFFDKESLRLKLYKFEKQKFPLIILVVSLTFVVLMLVQFYFSLNKSDPVLAQKLTLLIKEIVCIYILNIGFIYLVFKSQATLNIDKIKKTFWYKLSRKVFAGYIEELSDDQLVYFVHLANTADGDLCFFQILKEYKDKKFFSKAPFVNNLYYVYKKQIKQA